MGGKITKSLVFYGLPGKNLGLIIATSLYRRTPFGARHGPNEMILPPWCTAKAPFGARHGPDEMILPPWNILNHRGVFKNYLN